MTKQKIKNGVKYKLKKLINFFLKGLLVCLPILLTYYVVSSVVLSVDKMIPIDIPGIGFIVVIVGVTLIGWVGSSIISKPLFNLIDDFLSSLPFIKIIYTSVKDLMEAFVGEKKKFSKPVVVEFTEGVYKPGFITQDDLFEINLPGLVGVYFPHSYAFSGNLFFIDKAKIKLYEGNPTDFMKFIVSGGVTEIGN
ncbi:MAG: DUF502 domain-containing protein [Bacteroidia bacterium]|nr:DUF502 domain-containing protein [Bacteroidia bacterium]